MFKFEEILCPVATVWLLRVCRVPSRNWPTNFDILLWVLTFEICFLHGFKNTPGAGKSSQTFLLTLWTVRWKIVLNSSSEVIRGLIDWRLALKLVSQAKISVPSLLLSSKIKVFSKMAMKKLFVITSSFITAISHSFCFKEFLRLEEVLRRTFSTAAKGRVWHHSKKLSRYTFSASNSWILALGFNILNVGEKKR